MGTFTTPFLLFNLCDFSRVIQGCLLVRPSEGFGREQLCRLWVHESLRVFGDRLTEDADREWCFEHCKSMVSEHFDVAVADTFAHLCDDPAEAKEEAIDYAASRRVFFGDYMSEEDENRPYEEVQDRSALSLRIGECLDDFNALSPCRSPSLVAAPQRLATDPMSEGPWPASPLETIRSSVVQPCLAL